MCASSLEQPECIGCSVAWFFKKRVVVLLDKTYLMYPHQTNSHPILFFFFLPWSYRSCLLHFLWLDEHHYNFWQLGPPSENKDPLLTTTCQCEIFFCWRTFSLCQYCYIFYTLQPFVYTNIGFFAVFPSYQGHICMPLNNRNQHLFISSYAVPWTWTFTWD